MCLIIIWIAATIDYYLLWYNMFYLTDDVYLALLISATIDIIAFVVAFSIFESVGFVTSIYRGFIIAVVGASLFIFCLYVMTIDNLFIVSGTILLCKFGVAMAVLLSYIGTVLIFKPRV